MWPMSPCIPFKNFCQVRGGACFTLKVLGEKRLEKLMLGCEEDAKHKCGSQWRHPKTDFHYIFSCCSNKDNCNWKPWIRPWKNFDNEEISQVEKLKSTEAPATTSKGPIQNLDGSSAAI
ncbi:Hypothetical predicted protein [Podarcis lilfordi]|nr:Hypothetical predicted protein [Podarcis lilfordi]